MSNGRKKEVIRTIKYFVFTSSAGVIELVSFTILNQLTPFNYWPCYLIALVLSVLWNFTLNRRYTFKSNNNVPIAMVKVFVYYLIFTPFSTVLGNYLVERLFFNEYLVTILSMLINGVTEYLYQRLFVFRKSLDSAESNKENNRAVVL